MRDRSKISRTELLAIDIAAEQILHACAVGPWCSAEDTGDRRAFVRFRCPPSRSERVLVVVLLAGRDGACRGVEKCDLGGEQVSKQTRYAPSHVDPRPPYACGRHDLD